MRKQPLACNFAVGSNPGTLPGEESSQRVIERDPYLTTAEKKVGEDANQVFEHEFEDISDKDGRAVIAIPGF